jgi:uncharacterized protein (TIGR03435 family)
LPSGSSCGCTLRCDASLSTNSSRHGATGASVRAWPDQAPTIPVSAGAAPREDGPTLSDAIEEQLGLRLVDAEDEVDVIVIDAAERPGEN